MQYVRQHWLPILVIAIGVAVSLALALASFNFILTNLLSDDAFYYFQIARNIVHGLGSTFDGINLTNGYHPLWLIAIVPIFRALSTGGSADIAPIHSVLVLSALLYGAAGIALLALFGRYTKSAWIKASALGFLFLNPFMQYQMANGLETSLSIFFISLFFLCAVRVSEEHFTSRSIWAGIVGGFMMLARLDNVFYFVGYLAYLAYKKGIRKSIRSVLISGVAAAVVVVPWLIWNFANFGMLFTSSSVASAMVNHQLIIQDHGTSWFQTGKAVVYFTDHALRDVEPQTGIPLVLLILAGVCLGWFLFGRGRELLGRTPKSIPIELFVASGFVLDFVANASIRWTVRPWYFITINLLIAIWLAWFLEKLREGGYLRPIAASLVVVFSLGVFYINWSRNLRNTMPARNVQLVALWANDNLPKGAIIGAFNSGVQGYFGTHRVVNLDGLVNNNALAALQKKELWKYLHDEHIQYLSDYDLYLNYRYKSFLGIDNPLDHLQLVYEEPVTKLHVYKII